VAAEAGEVAGAGAAGIDQSGGAAASRDGGGVDPDRGAAPIDMGVQVDQPGRDEQTADIAGVGRGFVDALADGDDLPAGESDVAAGVDSLRGIDEVAAAQDEIKHGSP
jgi:hypothetical protein